MSKTLKSSLLFGFVFLIISGINYYWFNIYTGKKTKELSSQIREKETEYNDLKSLADRYYVLADSQIVLKTSYYEMDKILPVREDSRLSFEYLNLLTAVSNSEINFTFSAGGESESENYFTKSYILEGIASYYTLFNYIWKLEKYKRFYKIESLTMNEVKKADNPDKIPESFIKYYLVVTGYSSKEKLNSTEKITETKVLDPIAHNPFLPLVKEYIPPNKDNLLVVTEAKLQGLTGDRAFIVDPSGKLLVMRVGDKVYLGYLTKIDKSRNQVEFTLNKGGFIENVVLRLKE